MRTMDVVVRRPGPASTGARFWLHLIDVRAVSPLIGPRREQEEVLQEPQFARVRVHQGSSGNDPLEDCDDLPRVLH